MGPGAGECTTGAGGSAHMRWSAPAGLGGGARHPSTHTSCLHRMSFVIRVPRRMAAVALYTSPTRVMS